MISNCGHDERGKYSGGQAGDQTGGEWAIINWYNRPWNYVLRHPDASVREKIGELAKKAAENNLIGYDQNQRMTFWQHLKASNYDPAQITIKCEADCSSGVASIVKAAGYLLGNSKLQTVSSDCYTGNIRQVLKAAGFDVFTTSKYLTNEDYLCVGDILLYEYHHVATNLMNGSKSSGAQEVPEATSYTENVRSGQLWLNSNYGALIKCNYGVVLKVDGDYGIESRKGALAVWKDLVNRRYGTNLTPGNANFGTSCKAVAGRALVSYGSNGTFTFLAQFILAAKGFYNGLMDADCGSGTERAIRAFQTSVGLEEDGQCGADTWYALFN